MEPHTMKPHQIKHYINNLFEIGVPLTMNQYDFIDYCKKIGCLVSEPDDRGQVLIENKTDNKRYGLVLRKSGIAYTKVFDPIKVFDLTEYGWSLDGSTTVENWRKMLCLPNGEQDA